MRKSLELLPQDKDRDIQTKLADALLGQFAEEAIEPVREMVQRRAYDETCSDLMGRLVAISTIMGVTFPEYAIWKREAEERQALHERRMRTFDQFLPTPISPAPATPAIAKEPNDYVEQKRSPIFRTEKKVGRNDSCPCGSGQKFKKCCMRK